jgi:prophage antirepressor-like protein
MEIKNFEFIIDGICMATILCIIDASARNIWFKAKEIAEYLEYKAPTIAINAIIDELDKISYETLKVSFKLTLGADVPKYHPQTIFINESGLYTLLMKCTKPLAKPFQRWVTNEVLPAIRKTGSYTTVKTTHEQQKLERVAHIKMHSINELKRKHEDSLRQQTLLRHHEDVRAAVADDERRREMAVVVQQNSQMLAIIQGYQKTMETKDGQVDSLLGSVNSLVKAVETKDGHVEQLLRSNETKDEQIVQLVGQNTKLFKSVETLVAQVSQLAQRNPEPYAHEQNHQLPSSLRVAIEWVPLERMVTSAMGQDRHHERRNKRTGSVSLFDAKHADPNALLKRVKKAVLRYTDECPRRSARVKRPVRLTARTMKIVDDAIPIDETILRRIIAEVVAELQK